VLGVELGAGVDEEELSEPELDFDALSPEVDAEDESLLPSLDFALLSCDPPSFDPLSFDPLSEDLGAPEGFAL
jgi:hypothetical protein